MFIACQLLLREFCVPFTVLSHSVDFLSHFVEFQSFDFEGSNGKRSVEKRGYRGNDRQGDGIFFGDEDEDT